MKQELGRDKDFRDIALNQGIQRKGSVSLIYYFLRLLDKSRPASNVTGTASTDISAVAPAVILLFLFLFSELFSPMVLAFLELESPYKYYKTTDIC